MKKCVLKLTALMTVIYMGWSGIAQATDTSLLSCPVHFDEIVRLASSYTEEEASLGRRCFAGRSDSEIRRYLQMETTLAEIEFRKSKSEMNQGEFLRSLGAVLKMLSLDNKRAFLLSQTQINFIKDVEAEGGHMAKEIRRIIDQAQRENPNAAFCGDDHECGA